MLGSYHTFLIALTDLGDSAVLGGMAILTAIYLAAMKSRRAAAVLMLSFLATAGCMGVLKILFHDCGFQIMDFKIRSPSGHTALSAAVGGTLALIVTRQLQGWWRWMPVLIAAPLIIMIAMTRVMLGHHTPDEVIFGLLVGIAGFLGSYFFLWRAPVPRLDPRGPVLIVIVVAIALHGIRLPAEGLIHLLGLHLRHHIPACAMNVDEK